MHYFRIKPILYKLISLFIFETNYNHNIYTNYRLYYSDRTIMLLN